MENQALPITSTNFVDFSLGLGKSQVSVDCQIQGIYTPAELPVYYHSDGSGDPGSPAEFEIIGVSCPSICGKTWCWCREDRPDWFEFLDKCIMKHVEQDIEQFEQYCIDEVEYRDH